MSLKSQSGVIEVTWRNKDKPHVKDTFFVAADPAVYEKFRKDSSIPLVQVVEQFQVYWMRGDVKPDQPMKASLDQLEENFGDRTLETAIRKILLEGRSHGTAKSLHASHDRDSDLGKKMAPEKSSLKGFSAIHG